MTPETGPMTATDCHPAENGMLTLRTASDCLWILETRSFAKEERLELCKEEWLARFRINRVTMQERKGEEYFSHIISIVHLTIFKIYKCGNSK
jgi:hypothetical protein